MDRPRDAITDEMLPALIGPSNRGDCNVLGSLTPPYVFPVTPGSRAFVLGGATQGTGSQVSDGAVTAIFIPSGASGGPSLGTP